MTEQIYINGILMEREKGAEPIQLVYQSPILTSIDAIMSNRTNSVTFPMTDGNRLAIGYAAEQTDSVFPFRRHKAVYVRDGAQIFDGYGILLTITEDGYEMSFVWGNVSSFTAMKNLKLRSMQTDESEDYCTLPPTYGNYVNTQIDFGAGRQRPCITAEKVLARIESLCGVTGLTSTAGVNAPFSRYVLPLSNKVGDVNTHLCQGFCAYDGAYERRGQRYQFKERQGAPIYDPGKTFSEGELLTEDAASVLFRLVNRVTLCVKLVRDGAKHWPTDTTFAKFSVIGVTAQGAESILYEQTYTRIANPPEEFLPADPTRELWCTLTLAEASQTIDVSAYEYVYFSLLGVPPTGSVEGIDFFYDESQSWGNIYACLDPAKEEDAVYNDLYGLGHYTTPYGKHYPIFSNLPDWSASDFVKQLMLLEGLYAYADSPNHIRFVSADDILSNRSNAVDWTDKMVSLLPIERKTVLDGTAEHNLCVYAGDDARANGIIDSDDETLDYETEYIKSSFAASVGNRIAQYEVDDDGKITEKSVTQRVLKHLSYDRTVQGSRFDGALEWETLLQRPAYAALKSIMYRPHIIKVKIVCDIVTLLTLDFLKPVTLRQTGRYYAIRSLTTGDNGTAEVELIQI